MLDNLLNLNRTLRKAVKEESPYYVALVVIDKAAQKIMLGKRRDNGMYTGPGGSAHNGEHPKQAIIREAFEEANLQIKPRDLKDLPTHIAHNGKICHCFWIDVNSSLLAVHPGNDPDREVYRWEWFSLNEPLPTKMTAARMTTINDAKMRLYGLRKSILSNPNAGIDINTAEQSMDEMGSKGSQQWVLWLDSVSRDLSYGEVTEVNLSPALKLGISKIDDGIYSAFVRQDDPAEGNYGEVLCQLLKMTPEAMVQGLKAKGYIPREEVELEVPPEPNDSTGLLQALREFQGELHIHLAKSLFEKLRV